MSFLQDPGDYTIEWQGQVWLPSSASQSTSIYAPLGQPCPAHLVFTGGAQ